MIELRSGSRSSGHFRQTKIKFQMSGEDWKYKEIGPYVQFFYLVAVTFCFLIVLCRVVLFLIKENECPDGSPAVAANSSPFSLCLLLFLRLAPGSRALNNQLIQSQIETRAQQPSGGKRQNIGLSHYIECQRGAFPSNTHKSCKRSIIYQQLVPCHKSYNGTNNSSKAYPRSETQHSQSKKTQWKYLCSQCIESKDGSEMEFSLSFPPDGIFGGFLFPLSLRLICIRTRRKSL